MSKPVTTLFMLMSVDGKISTGSSDEPDVDANIIKQAHVIEWVHIK